MRGLGFFGTIMAVLMNQPRAGLQLNLTLANHPLALCYRHCYLVNRTFHVIYLNMILCCATPFES